MMEENYIRWHRKMRAERAVKNLKQNLFEARYIEEATQAKEVIMNMLPKEGVIGLGDSLTLHELHIIEALKEGGYNFLNPWEPGITREESLSRRRQAFQAEVFLTGTNAVTLDGKIVSTDGLGNRVAALIFGPKKVIVVAGINKLVENVEEALRRIKGIAAPLNVRRHTYPPDIRPPCGDTGFCSECKPPRRICCYTVIIEGCSRDPKRITVLLVGQELGF